MKDFRKWLWILTGYLYFDQDGIKVHTLQIEFDSCVLEKKKFLIKIQMIK